MSTAAATSEKAWMLATLKELAELGMAQARQLSTDASSFAKASEDGRQPGSNAAADNALRFSRISRAVRQTVALYGLVLEDKLPGPAEAAGPRVPKPPSAELTAKGAKVRALDHSVDIALHRMAPPEAVEAFRAEVMEWREDHSFDHLYAGRIREVIGEILLMLGLEVPAGMIHHDSQDAIQRAFSAGEAQPWRASWDFLQGRERPHLALVEGWDPWAVPRRRRAVDERREDQALAEGP